MVYGYYKTDTVGNKRFFVEGCSYCSMSTGGRHEAECPCKNLKVADEDTHDEKLRKIRECSHIQYGEAWQKLADL